MRYQIFGLIVLLLVATAGGALAGTTGRLSGLVSDEEGTPLAGAKVTVDSPSSIGEPPMTATGINGTFQFPALTPGLYTVQVELQGFAPQEVPDIPVRLDNTTQLTFTMPLGQFASGVQVVSAAPLIDPTQVSIAESFTIDYLDDAAVGSGNRSYQQILLHAAGTTGPDLDAVNPQGVNGISPGGNQNVLGSTTGENAYFVDGIETTDPVTGTFGNNFNYDAIQEISFIKGGYEAEYGLASAGLINLITKSGGDTFSGALDVRYSPDSFAEGGEFFDDDVSEIEERTSSFTLGGPISRDKLWFFVSAEDVDSEFRIGEGLIEGNEFSGQNYIAKLTWSINPDWELVFKTFTDPADIDSAVDAFTAPEARERQDQGALISQVNILGVLAGDVFWDLGLGVQRQELDTVPTTGDLSAPGRFNVAGDTTFLFGNLQDARFSDRERDQLKTNFLFQLDSAAGFQAVKFGLDVSERLLEKELVPTGKGGSDPRGVGYFFADFDDEATILSRTTSTGVVESEGTFTSAYAQDTWDIASNLTLKIGLRWDQAEYDNNVNTEVASLDRLQPRIGLAWDVERDGRTVARISWGQFMHPAILTLPDLANTVGSGGRDTFVSCTFAGLTREQCETFAQGQGIEFIDDPFGRDPNGWVLNQPAAPFVPTLVADGLDPTYAEMISVAVERELMSGTSLEVAYVEKTTEDIFEDTCRGNLEDPADPTLCDRFVVGHLEQLTRDYEGLSATLRSRFKKRLNILASYTYAKSEGNVEYTQYQGSDFDFFPENFTNRLGFLSDDRQHRVKLNGYVLLPQDIVLSFNGFWSSDFKWTPVRFTEFGFLEFVEERGSRSGEDNYQLDLQINKGFELGMVRIELIASVFNLLDDEQALSVCAFEDGCGTAGFGEPTFYQLPRRYQAGLRIEF